MRNDALAALVVAGIIVAVVAGHLCFGAGVGMACESVCGGEARWIDSACACVILERIEPALEAPDTFRAMQKFKIEPSEDVDYE